GRYEAVVSVAVHRRGKPYNAGAYAMGGEGERQLRGGPPGLRTATQMRRRVWTVPVLFGRHPSGDEPERARGDEQRSIGPGKRLAECLDGAAIRVGGGLEASGERDVVLEREVDHAIRCDSCAPQAVEIIKSAGIHLCPGRGEGGGRGIRAGEPDDVMAHADEFRNEGGADPAGRAGDKHTHGTTSE